MNQSKVSLPKISRAGRKKGITLGSGDIAVIQAVVTEGFQTFQEVREGGFKGWHRVSAWQRMKRLVQAGYLHECRNDQGGILGWAINAKGASKILLDGHEAITEAKRAPVYRTSFSHDEALRGIRRVLSSSPVVTKWVPEYVLKAEVMRKFHYLQGRDQREKLLNVPDAILHLKSGGVASKAALELELTQKSRRRLYQKFERYMISQDFDYALFIAKDERLKARFEEICRDVASQSIHVKITKERNGIYFTTLPLLQRDGFHAKFIGTHDTFSFADLED